ncbi:MAG TPA: putative baseplate assembly protein, partial [Steroidobacteraceae bacterium]|nr:putative baseplate assembly protein [Steroidobacteraceae bacterium]
LSPGLSVQTAAAGSTATHRFTLTNTSSETLNCTLATLGGKWASSVERTQITLPPGLASEIKVSVTVPAEAANVGDRGFLNVRFAGEEPLCSVAFETLVGAVAPGRRELRFEYWNGSGWAKLLALDGTNALSEPGVVELLAPADFHASEQFGVSAYWIRAVFDSGDDQPVQLRTLLLNTTFATQAVTLRNEVLGSSDASANLQFRTTRSPVLAGAQLEVREAGATQPPGESWVSWTEVPDFHGSTSQDRHYVLDHVSGTVLFGDGVQGRIPPRGVGNVRMARYQTGGGSAGNRPAGAIVQLKTTVPYIDKVTNFEPATGGIDAEPDAAFVARAPRLLRNGGRAVAFDDYEDLARAASPEVARARAVPLRRLDTDPVGTNRVPGAVSIVVVPQSLDAKPTPSTTLLARVEQHVRSLSTPTATVAAVGPIYVRVDVSLEIALVSLDGASAVEIAVREALRAFLHPLTGGRNGAGWDFGREPALSDLHAVVAGVAGVDHIRALHVDQVEELQGALNTDRFLVYSGHHQITLT